MPDEEYDDSAYDDSDTFGGRLRRIEAGARAIGAWGMVAQADQIRTVGRVATVDAMRHMGMDVDL
jgi:hypothetical protein